MPVGMVYREWSARLEEYLELFGMDAGAGPLRAMGELVRGIVLTGSVQLTNAGRLTADTPARLAQTVKRLGEHLANPRWNHRSWMRAIVAEPVRDLAEDELVPVDATERAKPYARKMQYQCTVRDASRQIMGEKGIWLSDRGADRPEVLSVWLRLRRRWIIRLREDRALVGPDGQVRSAGAWADWALANRSPLGRAVTLPVYLPRENVAQEGPAVRLHLVVPTYTFRSGELWVLLTRGLIGCHTGPRQVRYDYAGRWRAEDGKRFLGQLWHVERFLVRSFLALERLLVCVVAAGGFLARLQEDEPELAQALENLLVYWDKPFLIPGYRLSHGILAAARAEGPPTLAVNA